MDLDARLGVSYFNGVFREQVLECSAFPFFEDRVLFQGPAGMDVNFSSLVRVSCPGPLEC